MVSEAAITAFRASLRGVSFAPGEPGYHAARIVFNRIDRPASSAHREVCRRGGRDRLCRLCP